MPSVQRLVVDGLGRLPQFSHAGITDDLVFVAGTLGTVDALTLAPGGIGPETTQTLRNMERILDAADLTWDDVAKVDVFVADMDEFGAMNEAYGAFFEGTPPARITIGGVQLALGARVEMQCVAQRPVPLERRGTTARAIPRRGGFLERDGERIYFEVCGDGGLPLVLCHGAGGSHAAWFQQVSAFAGERRVVTWDHRGFGRSTDHAGSSGPEVAVGDLLALLDHLGIARADLVGQSMGGWTVVGALLARPGLARRVVLADTLGGFRSAEISAALEAPRVTAPTSDGLTLGVHPALDPRFSARRPDLAHLYQSLGQMGTADANLIISRLLAVRHDAAEAATLTMPVLCVVGDRDPLFPPASIRAMAQLLPDARVVELPGCGHSPYFEDPEAWNLVVGRFIDVGRDQPGAVPPTP